MNIYKVIWVTLVCATLIPICHAQEVDDWVFGNQAILSNSGATPEITNNSKSHGGMIVQLDCHGNLMFYCDGYELFNADGSSYEFSPGNYFLDHPVGDPTDQVDRFTERGQVGVSVPDYNDDAKFHLFTVPHEEYNRIKGLDHIELTFDYETNSIVPGSVTQTELSPPVKIYNNGWARTSIGRGIAVCVQDSRTLVIVKRVDALEPLAPPSAANTGRPRRSFAIVQLDASGVSNAQDGWYVPFENVVLDAITPNALGPRVCLVASPKGDQIAMALSGSNTDDGLYIFSIDTDVSNPLPIMGVQRLANNPSFHDMEYSADGQFLYATKGRDVILSPGVYSFDVGDAFSQGAPPIQLNTFFDYHPFPTELQGNSFVYGQLLRRGDDIVMTQINGDVIGQAFDFGPGQLNTLLNTNSGAVNIVFDSPAVDFGFVYNGLPTSPIRANLSRATPSISNVYYDDLEFNSSLRNTGLDVVISESEFIIGGASHAAADDNFNSAVLITSGTCPSTISLLNDGIRSMEASALTVLDDGTVVAAGHVQSSAIGQSNIFISDVDNGDFLNSREFVMENTASNDSGFDRINAIEAVGENTIYAIGESSNATGVFPEKRQTLVIANKNTGSWQVPHSRIITNQSIRGSSSGNDIKVRDQKAHVVGQYTYQFNDPLSGEIYEKTQASLSLYTGSGNLTIFKNIGLFDIVEDEDTQYPLYERGLNALEIVGENVYITGYVRGDSDEDGDFDYKNVSILKDDITLFQSVEQEFVSDVIPNQNSPTAWNFTYALNSWENTQGFMTSVGNDVLVSEDGFVYVCGTASELNGQSLVEKGFILRLNSSDPFDRSIRIYDFSSANSRFVSMAENTSDHTIVITGSIEQATNSPSESQIHRVVIGNAFHSDFGQECDFQFWPNLEIFIRDKVETIVGAQTEAYLSSSSEPFSDVPHNIVDVFVCEKSFTSNSQPRMDSQDVLISDENDALLFDLYPNPVLNIMNVRAEFACASVSVYDIEGRQYLNEDTRGLATLKVDVSVLDSGVYLIVLIDNNGVQHVKRFTK